jgi:hypothetical protein
LIIIIIVAVELYGAVFLDNSIVAQLVEKITASMEPYVSLACLQNPSFGPVWSHLNPVNSFTPLRFQDQNFARTSLFPYACCVLLDKISKKIVGEENKL